MKLVKIMLIGVVALTAVYLVLPAPQFPPVPPTAIQSDEPGDTESSYRKAYYTNLSREEIMAYYFKQFGGWGIKLNHPFEEAQTLIRDQTRSSYLEEIVHPGRETLYINGYVPQLPKDQINRNGQHYLNKVTVRLIPSHLVARLTLLLMVAVISYWLGKEYAQ